MLDYIPHLENDKKLVKGVTSSNTDNDNEIDLSNIPIPLQILINAQPSTLINNMSDTLFTLGNINLQPVTNRPDTDLFDDMLNHEVISSVFSTLKDELGELNNTVISVLYGSKVNSEEAAFYDNNLISTMLTMEFNGEKINYESLLYNTKIIKLLYEYFRYANGYVESVMGVIDNAKYFFEEDKGLIAERKDIEILGFDSKQDLFELGESIKYVSSNSVVCNLFKSCYNLIIDIDDITSIRIINDNQEKAYSIAKEKLVIKLNTKLRELFAAIEYCKQQFNSFSDIFYERNELIKSFCDNINNKTT